MLCSKESIYPTSATGVSAGFPAACYQHVGIAQALIGDLSAYLMVYGVVSVPGVIFVTARVVALNALLRNKNLAYAVVVGTAAGLFYLYSNHWRYNPLHYQLWQYSDLGSARILTSRLYWLIVAAACLALAHLFFERRST